MIMFICSYTSIFQMCNCCGQKTIYQTKLSYLVSNYLQNNFFRQKILSFTKYIVDFFLLMTLWLTKSKSKFSLLWYQLWTWSHCHYQNSGHTWKWDGRFWIKDDFLHNTKLPRNTPILWKNINKGGCFLFLAPCGSIPNLCLTKSNLK